MAANLTIALNRGSAIQQVHPFQNGILTVPRLKRKCRLPDLTLPGVMLPFCLFLLFKSRIVSEKIKLYWRFFQDLILWNQLDSHNIYTSDGEIFAHDSVVQFHHAIHDSLCG